MKIIITDKIFLEENHVQQLKQFGELIVYEDLPNTEKMLIKRLENADIAIVGFCKIPASVINLLMKLNMSELF